MLLDKIKDIVSKVAAIGAVRRKGIGALSSYGGRVSGKGYIIDSTTKVKTHFALSGGPSSD